MPRSPRSKPAAGAKMPSRDDALIARLDAIAAGLVAHRKAMFGTVAWFLDANDQMFAGAWGDEMNVRLGGDEAARLIASGAAGAFAPMAGRPMREYVLLPAAALPDDELAAWLDRAAAFAATLAPKQRR